MYECINNIKQNSSTLYYRNSTKQNNNENINSADIHTIANAIKIKLNFCL